MPNPNEVQVYVANHPKIYCNTVTLTTQNPMQALPGKKVPDNVGVVVKSDPSNPVGSIILVDGLRPSATSYPLAPSDNITLYPQDDSEIWVGSRNPIPAGGLIIDIIHEVDE